MKELQVTIKSESDSPPFQAENLLVCDRSVTFRNDRDFLSIYKDLAENAKEKERKWRVHVFLWAFKNGLLLDGDIIECGVFRGFSSAVAVRYTEFEKIDKKLFLFDTWEGIPEAQMDKDRKQIEAYKNIENYEKVVERFSSYKNVKLIKGQVPDVFKTIEMPKKISFLHLDMNNATAEIGALEALFEKMVKGAICILDDFGFQIAREQTRAETDWFSKRGFPICEIPTGQGIVIKV